ncbi:hypothetical protein JYU02_00980 [bacterium AH-315-P15]|nr:hypothetical protein [bacterium AH-315-P15]
MKVKIEIECTPQEARSFFGLPDLEPLHEVMTENLKERMEAAAALMEPEALMRAWMPGGAGFDQMRDVFFSALGQASGGKAQASGGRAQASGGMGKAGGTKSDE